MSRKIRNSADSASSWRSSIPRALILTPLDGNASGSLESLPTTLQPPSHSHMSNPPSYKCSMQSSTSSGTVLAAQKHHRFFLPDGNVTFLVEETRYCVHRFFFQQYSENFALKYKLCDDFGKTAFIHLKGIETCDFDQLLSIFYPFTLSSPYPETKTVDEWTSVLRLATKWEFSSLRKLAIDRLFDITSPIDKVILSHSFDIPTWLPAAYVDICERDQPLTLEEGRRLLDLGSIGGDIIILLSQACHELNSISPPRAKNIVRKVFGLECMKEELLDQKDMQVGEAPERIPSSRPLYSPGRRNTNPANAISPIFWGRERVA